ncbi:hypothetical protein ACER0C_002204 [Sarotherodon galilaeus]
MGAVQSVTTPPIVHHTLNLMAEGCLGGTVFFSYISLKQPNTPAATLCLVPVRMGLSLPCSCTSHDSRGIQVLCNDTIARSNSTVQSTDSSNTSESSLGVSGLQHGSDIRRGSASLVL